jgi:pimeloyl-ACP methyl ester carboxylesterase
MTDRPDPPPPVPPRPSAREERWSWKLFRVVSPRLEKVELLPPPDSLRPFEEVRVPRPPRGELSALWFPAAGTARGAVLLLHPWVPWGKTYFYRRGRIAALRREGYHALVLDLSGFGTSSKPAGFLDRDVEAGLAALRERAPGLPLHVWGVSSGGHWAHPVLARSTDVASAMFEDVSPHLFEWSWRMAPLFRPCYLFFRTVFPTSHRYLDMRRHAAAFRLGAVTYLSGEGDRGVLPEDTRALATAAGGEARIVAGAGHLGSIKVATEEVLALAFDTFRRGEEARGLAAIVHSGKR